MSIHQLSDCYLFSFYLGKSIADLTVIFSHFTLVNQLLKEYLPSQIDFKKSWLRLERTLRQHASRWGRCRWPRTAASKVASRGIHTAQSTGLRWYAQTLPSTTLRRAFSTVWLVGQAGQRVGWSRPRGHPRWQDRRAVRLPAGGRTGWAEAQVGPYRPTRASKKERE